MDRRWFRLLETYKQDGHVGLTLSFLIGALRTPVGTLADDDTSRSELLLLLRRMRDETPKGLYVRIAECQTLHQPIAALFPGDPMAGSPSAGDLVVGDSSPSRLHAWPQYFDDETRSVD